jgi:RNA methyltransferase, TrmH family
MDNFVLKRYKKEDEYSYCLGLTLTIELLKFKPEQAVKIFVRGNIDKEEGYTLLSSLAKKQGIEIVVNTKAFNILDAKENCFAIGVFKKYDSMLETNKNHICLVNPSDAGNLGTIMRSALGFGIKNIAIISPAVDEFSTKAVRSSMGAIFSLNIMRFDSFNEYEKFAKIRTYFPFMLKAKYSLADISKDLTKDIYTLIFGNEATGLDDSFLEIGKPIIIKHSHSIDSINLPIAVSIALYEFAKYSELK